MFYILNYKYHEQLLSLFFFNNNNKNKRISMAKIELCIIRLLSLLLKHSLIFHRTGRSAKYRCGSNFEFFLDNTIN